MLEINELSDLLLDGLFGLEKENLRVTAQGKLALTPHPKIFGDKSENRFITTDFSESQVEMITPPLGSIDEACNFIHTLHDIVTEEIGEELLWPQSLPALLPNEDSIPVARYSGANKSDEEYREMIAEVYGTNRQMMCGIHFNVSLSDRFFSELSQRSGEPIATLKERLYLKITRGIMRHRWLLMWLFGETPVTEPDFKVLSLDEEPKYEKIRCKDGIALRSGPGGYRNRKDYVMDFSSMEAYNRRVQSLIDSGELRYAKELYLPVRLKCLEKDGGAPSYIEIRFLDLDPLCSYGVNSDALYSAHALFLYALLEEESSEFCESRQSIATRMGDVVSCVGRRADAHFPEDIADGGLISSEVQRLVLEMKSVLQSYGILNQERYMEVFQRMEYLALNPDERSGTKVFRESQREGFISWHLALAKEYKAESQGVGYRFWGFEEMELSTQLLMRASLCRGVAVELVDRSDNFIRLIRGDKCSLVKQATKTELDNYATVMAMENKVVTKKVLSRSGIRVPSGGEYSSPESAMADSASYLGDEIVVKPKSTNFGIGITILKGNWSIEDYEKALEIAFAADSTVLVEEFISGKEYRIFVIDGRVVGVLHRVPANVEGNGLSTITKLVELKNRDPRRGKGYRTPLEKINLGVEEKMFLAMQGLSVDYIAKAGEVIFLRENSNISTGGDSLDFTDELHPSYAAIAVKAAEAMGAKITGVDMMIEEISVDAKDGGYSIIEVNFNPAIHIHCYPYKGKNRRLNFLVLEALGY